MTAMIVAGPVYPAYFLYSALWNALDWVFPPTCPGCHQIGERWCSTCQQQVSPIREPICQRCGDPLAGHKAAGLLVSSQSLCPDCDAHPPDYQALRSFAEFTGTLREALHVLKYKRDIGIGVGLSKHLIELYNDLNWGVDIIAPVPLSPKRLRERGYNQSSYLARPLAYAIHKPYRPQILKRVRETQSQVGLSAQDRQKNVGGAFKAQPTHVKGKVILIIDDVTTTGSTINACAQALCEAGASAVFGLTLARAVLRADDGSRTIIQPTLSNPSGGTHGS